MDSFRFQSKSCLLSKIKEILAKAWIYIMQGCLSLLNTFFMKDYRNYVVRISWFTRRWTLYLFDCTRSLHIVRNLEMLDFFYHSHRIADTQEFRSNSIRTIKDSYENKKRIDWTDSKRTDARSDGAWKENGRNLTDRVTGARRKAIWFTQYPAGALVVHAIVSE